MRLLHSSQGASTTCTGDDLVTETFMRAAHAGRFRLCDLMASGRRWTPLRSARARGDASEWQNPWALWETSPASEFVARPPVRTCLCQQIHRCCMIN
jgi:hypothetical protein